MVHEKAVPVITIDGPSGTGKGTICHLMASALNWHFLDSGAIYRVCAYAVRQQEMTLTDIDAIAALAYKLDFHFKLDEQGKSRTFLDDTDITELIRTEKCGDDASTLGAVPAVREALLMCQRAFAKSPGLVTDGRDMGTVVFPEAQVKIYLDASPEERAIRRYLQLQESGNNASLAQVIKELERRDARDRSRTCAPLKPAVDAIRVDTTGLTVTQTFDHVLKLARDKLGGK